MRIDDRIENEEKKKITSNELFFIYYQISYTIFTNNLLNRKKKLFHPLN